MSTAVVLLSGGQDSTTCLYWAKSRFERVASVAFEYGQRHRSELEAAAEIAALAEVDHRLIQLLALRQLAGSPLVSGGAICANGGLADAHAPDGLPTSFVPGRNLIFFSAAAALAAKLGARDLVSGVCETDYSGYPDCRREFIDAAEQAATLAMPSSLRPIRIHTPLMDLDKAQTVRLAQQLPGCWEALARTVTCYEGHRPGCGYCPACELRARGFRKAGETDPSRCA